MKMLPCTLDGHTCDQAQVGSSLLNEAFIGIHVPLRRPLATAGRRARSSPETSTCKSKEDMKWP